MHPPRPATNPSGWSIKGGIEMEVERQIANAPKTTAVGVAVSEMGGNCIGCTNCRGLCQALIEVMSFPEVVLNRS
jgi:hypothetical protein